MDEIKKAKKKRRAQIRKAAKKANKTVAEYKEHPNFLKRWPEVEVPTETAEVEADTSSTEDEAEKLAS